LEFSFLCEALNKGEARPGLSGALFLFSQKRKKRERKTDNGAQSINKELLIHKI